MATRRWGVFWMWRCDGRAPEQGSLCTDPSRRMRSGAGSGVGGALFETAQSCAARASRGICSAKDRVESTKRQQTPRAQSHSGASGSYPSLHAS
jgi:hypothetical protein